SLIGIYVGLGVNFLSGFRTKGGRVVLSNGSHRAFALRASGITHAPFLVADITRDEEFDLVTPPELKQRPDQYLKDARPPLLKDYFTPALYKVIRASRRHQLLQIQITLQESEIGAL